ncbi:MAG: helix-turn-helix transcriptional regulator [Patescibacteria group bacterium]
MKPLNQRLGERLKKVRQEKGMSQGDIARKLGVHRSYISGIERGVRNPTIKNIEKIATALGVSPHTLLQ